MAKLLLPLAHVCCPHRQRSAPPAAPLPLLKRCCFSCLLKTTVNVATHGLRMQRQPEPPHYYTHTIHTLYTHYTHTYTLWCNVTVPGFCMLLETPVACSGFTHKSFHHWLMTTTWRNDDTCRSDLSHRIYTTCPQQNCHWLQAFSHTHTHTHTHAIYQTAQADLHQTVTVCKQYFLKSRRIL